MIYSVRNIPTWLRSHLNNQRLPGSPHLTTWVSLSIENVSISCNKKFIKTGGRLIFAGQIDGSQIKRESVWTTSQQFLDSQTVWYRFIIMHLNSYMLTKLLDFMLRCCLKNWWKACNNYEFHPFMYHRDKFGLLHVSGVFYLSADSRFPQ